MKIFNTIKQIRISKGLNQKQISSIMNISQSAYAKIENGQTEISMVRLEQLAEALGMNLFDILTFSGISNLNDYIDPKGGVRISDLEDTNILKSGNSKYVHNLYEHIRNRDNELIKELREKVSLYKQLYESLLAKLEEQEKNESRILTNIL